MQKYKNIIILLIILKVLFTSCILYADSRLDNCEQYKYDIISILQQENININYYYLAVCESGCKNKKSHKNAYGFFQITKPTFMSYSDNNCKDINSLKCNTLAAAHYIKHLETKFKETIISNIVKMYNMGGHNYKKFGPTKEANGLSYCVINYINKNNLTTTEGI